MTDKTRKASRDTLCSKSNPERLIMCSYHTDTPLRTKNFGMYCPKCAEQKGELLAAVKPFAEVFEKVRAFNEPSEGHDRPVEMQGFLDGNQVVPSGTNVGHWRKLADVFRRLVLDV